MEKFGIDVSDWQNRIDWETVKPQIDFAIVKLGYGRGNWDDEARNNIEALNRLGIPYGIYWFSYAYTVGMAENEARACLRFMEECTARPVYPVFFDWEYASREWTDGNDNPVSDGLLRNMTIAFCDGITAAGYKTGVYANDDYVAHHYGKNWFSEHGLDLWYAYPGASSDHGAAMWQFGRNYIAGIDGKVDVNTCYKDYEEEEDVEKRFDTIEECPGYAHGTLQHLKSLMESRGQRLGREDGRLDLSEDQLRILVLLHKAGVF